MPENKNPAGEKNDTQKNSENSAVKIFCDEKSLSIITKEIKEYITEQNSRNETTNTTNQKILLELIETNKKKSYNLAGVIVQGVLAVLTLGMLILFVISMYKQDSTTKKSLQYTKTADSINEQTFISAKISDSIRFAKDSIDRINAQKINDYTFFLTNKTIDNQIDISRTDLRPYLCFDRQAEEELGGYLVPQEGTYYPIIIVKNFGNTPAFDVTTGIASRKRPDFKNEQFPILSDGIIQGFPMVPPGKEIKIPLFTKKNSIDKDALKEINSGIVYLFFFIRINYTQHVGSTIINHHTQFSVYYNPVMGQVVQYSGVDISGEGFDSDY